MGWGGRAASSALCNGEVYGRSHRCAPELGRQPSQGLSTRRGCRRTFPKSLQPERRAGEWSSTAALHSETKRSKVDAGLVQVHSPPPLHTLHPPRQYPGGESRWSPETWRAWKAGASHPTARQQAVSASRRARLLHLTPSRAA